MWTAQSEQVWRNYGFVNEAEQNELLTNQTVAIAGTGGGGYQIGVKLAMMGFQNFKLADPEVWEAANINRVTGAKTSTLDRNKAETLREEILDINNDAKVDVYTDGVTTDNVDDFLHGSTLVFDETELSLPHVGTLINRKARQRELPVVNANFIGWAGQVTSFDPKGKMTFEKLMGLPERNDLADLDEISEMTIAPSRYLAYLPTYGDLRTLIAVQDGASLPSIAEGVDMMSGLAATEAFLHAVQKVSRHRRQPTWAPHIRYADAYTGRAGIIRHPRLSHYSRLGYAVMRDQVLKVNEKASYSNADRLARGDLKGVTTDVK